MDFVNFRTFETRSPLLTSDYLVGYKTTGPTEIKTQVKDILNLVQNQNYIQSNVTTVPTATAINNIVTLSQAAYDSIEVRDPNTLYYIV